MKTAKIFRSGNSQAVRLPKEFRVTDDEVFIKKTGGMIVLIPKKGGRWKNVKACAGRFKGELERKQPRTFDERPWPQ
jgi:antitoxin VapB